MKASCFRKANDSFNHALARSLFYISFMDFISASLVARVSTRFRHGHVHQKG